MCLPLCCIWVWLISFQVYQVVRKIVDDQPDTGRIRLSPPVIYDAIKKSNSSLNRKPKKLLEDSIERVLEVMKRDGEDEEDSVVGDFEGLEEPPATVRICADLIDTAGFADTMVLRKRMG